MKWIIKIWLPLLLAVCLLTACVSSPAPSEIPGDPDLPIESESESETEAAEPTPADLYEPFVPVVRFVVCSDVHVLEDPDCKEAGNLKKLFETAYRYADSQEDYQALDAVVIVGDLTENGKGEEFEMLKYLFKDCVREETTLITMLGNHEHYSRNINPYKFILTRDLNQHHVIGGYHFISVSLDASSSEYSEKTIEWMKTELAAAAVDTPDKPIFTFQHHHLKDTVYITRMWTNDPAAGLGESYALYPNVINFSGHSHGPINNPRSIWQDRFTMIGTGTLARFEMEDTLTVGAYPEGYENAAQYLIVEVNADNVVKVMPYNLLTDDFMKTPSNTDDPDAQLVYYLPTGGTDGFVYTAERYETAGTPHFTENAAITVSDITATTATVTVPQALDDDCIYSYSLRYAADGEEQEVSYFSEYYVEPMPETVSYTLTDLKPGTEYTVTVTPVNVWEKAGEPITTTFTTTSES